MMNHYYLDTKTEHRGYFSHVDAVTLKYDEEALGDNKEQKNWNSIGDHIPAYLVNLMLALEPVPAGSSKEISSFIEKAQWMLKETSDLIMTKFPDPDPEVPYVNERFYTDWKPWQTWRWQQNGAVCGHNLKIAWNMIRSANYFSDKDKEFSENLTQLCCTLGDDLGKLGVDQLRGGLFDVVERKPKNGMFLDFRFWDTKDFWQQEQAILAYYILYGRTNNAEYLKLAREQAAFYNTFFLNHDDNGVYFRTNGDGLPYLVGDYRQAGGHSKSGYHAFELCYLADMYTKMYVTKEKFTLHFKPTDAPRENPNVLNVAPEFVEHGTVKIFSYSVNGEERFPADPFEMTVKLNPGELGADTDVCVTFEPQSFSSYGS